MPMLSGGYIHASAVKVLSMLGVGRAFSKPGPSDLRWRPRS